MALLGGPAIRRGTPAHKKELARRRKIYRSRNLKEAGPGRVIFKAGGSLLRRFGKKIPFVKKFVPGSKERIIAAERATGLSRSLPGTARVYPRGLGLPKFVSKPAVITAGKKIVLLGGAGATIEGGSRALEAILPSPVITVRPSAVVETIFGGGTQSMAHPSIGTGSRGSTGLQLGGTAPLGNTIVKTWNTGTAQFARDASGMHYVLKKDGTIKRFRPPRPVVVPKNWNARSMNRVMRRLESHRTAAIKLVTMLGGSASKTRTSRRQHSQTHP